MTPQPKLSVKTLDEQTLHELARQSGPCLSICLPGRRPGATELPRSTVLLNLLREADSLVQDQPDLATDFLTPVRDLLKASDLNDGGDSLTIFRSPDFLLLGESQTAQQPRTILGSHFLIAPFLEAAAARREVYLLALNQKQLHLYHWVNGECMECEFPQGVPTSLEAAMAFDVPDHHRVNQSSAGPSTGAMGGVRFGTSSDADNTQTHMRDFFKQVDRGLKDLLRKHQLIVGGVPQLTALYRSLAEHTQVLAEDLPGDLPYSNKSDIAARLHASMLHYYQRQGLEVLAKHSEHRDRTRAISGPDMVFDAAAGGRVHQLVCASEAAGEAGNNAAIAEALRHGGEVFLVPQSAMQNGSASAAILRY